MSRALSKYTWIPMIRRRGTWQLVGALVATSVVAGAPRIALGAPGAAVPAAVPSSRRRRLPRRPRPPRRSLR